MLLLRPAHGGLPTMEALICIAPASLFLPPPPVPRTCGRDEFGMIYAD